MSLFRLSSGWHYKDTIPEKGNYEGGFRGMKTGEAKSVIMLPISLNITTFTVGNQWGYVKKNAYHFVIQTTVGRKTSCWGLYPKNLDTIKGVPEILRFALDDKMVLLLLSQTTFLFGRSDVFPSSNGTKRPQCVLYWFAWQLQQICLVVPSSDSLPIPLRMTMISFHCSSPRRESIWLSQSCLITSSSAASTSSFDDYEVVVFSSILFFSLL